MKVLFIYTFQEQEQELQPTRATIYRQSYNTQLLRLSELKTITAETVSPLVDHDN